MRAGFVLRFYLGLGAPAARSRRRDCALCAARGYSCDMIADLLFRYQHEQEHIITVKRINHRCATVTLPATGERFFFKEFPRHHGFHDLERALRLSRVDRAWRAAHLLPGLGILTPRAVGTAETIGSDGSATEYLATEWLADVTPYPAVVRAAGEDQDRRLNLLREFAAYLGRWHRQGVYVRDLVKNVLLREEGESRQECRSYYGEAPTARRLFWLTDLDGFHPLRRVTRGRILHHLRQLAHHVGPLSEEEALAACGSYLAVGRGGGAASGAERRAQEPHSDWGEEIVKALMTPPGP
jgi:hypothetical protein